MAPTAPPGSTCRPAAAAIPAADRIGIEDVRRAAEQLRGVAVPTPLLSCPAPGGGGQVHLKCELLQRTGSFKLRGAFVHVARLPAAARRRGIVAASAGNHAQGVALAAAHFGVPAVVYMPAGAPAVKVAATEALGATVELVPGTVTESLAAAQRHVAERGSVFVHPFDHPDVIAGQGTIGLELLEQLPELGTVLVPVGGGGLLAGVASAVHAQRPGVRVVGVQADGAAAFAASFRSGRPATSSPVATMADGIAVERPGTRTLAICRQLVDEVLTVPDAAIWLAMRHCLEHLGLVVEPAGAAGLAALWLRASRAFPQPVAAVVSGGNIDARLRARLLLETVA
ncbi:MAG TPA: threonine/serine dehydratase [Actinomycetes bacterium]